MDVQRRSERPTKAPAAARFLVARPFRVGDSPDVTPSGSFVADGDVAPAVLLRLIQTSTVVDEVLVKARDAEREARATLERAGLELENAVDRAGALGGAVAVTRSTPVPATAAEREARLQVIATTTARCAAAEAEARDAAAAVERASAAVTGAVAEREREEARVAAIVASLRSGNAPTGEGA